MSDENIQNRRNGFKIHNNHIEYFDKIKRWNKEKMVKDNQFETQKLKQKKTGCIIYKLSSKKFSGNLLSYFSDYL
jgi:hypothetical protein